MPSIVIGKVKGDTGEAGVSPIVKLQKNESILSISVTDLEGTKTESINVQENVQSDWNVTDTALDSYIKNKPEIPNKTSQLENDSGFITDYTETDPTVPAWAKKATKPEYTATEVGALPSDTTHLSGDVPITRKINGRTLNADITLSAFDVGALSDDTIIPTYSAGTGISLSGTTFSNSGVRAVSSGSANGTISVNTNGTSTDVAVKGLGSAAYTESSAYAKASHGTHVTFGTNTPKANGTASVGTSTNVAREDHVHPLQTSVTGSSGSCTGNAATATKATGDASGNTITTTYASSASLSGNNLLLKSKSGATLSTVDLSSLSGTGGSSIYYQTATPASAPQGSVWIGA